MQQYRGLREQGITCPDPRRQLFDELTTQLHEWKAKRYHPIVMGDLNSVHESADLKTFLNENSLWDIIDETNDGRPHRTYARSQRRLDYILGDRFILNACRKSGALALHEGVISDHTLQWVDLDSKKLFRTKEDIPLCSHEREFTLANPVRKHAYQEKLINIFKHQKIPERVQTLADELKVATANDDGQIIIPLVAHYQKLDGEIRQAMTDAAKGAGRANFGYQRSPKLVSAGQTCVFWKAVLSCKRRNSEYSSRIENLSATLKIPHGSYDSLTYKETRQKLAEASKTKRKLQKEDGEHRAKWLEELAKEAAIDKPDSDWEQILKKMISAARQRSVQRKLTTIMKGSRTGLDYIELPNDQWQYSATKDELYEFDEGLFKAHLRLPDGTFRLASILKVPYKDAVGVQIRQGKTITITPPRGPWLYSAKTNMLYNQSSDHSRAHLRNDDGTFRHTSIAGEPYADSVEVEVTIHDTHITLDSKPPTTTWTRVTTHADIEQWLCRRNKRHHQQVYHDQSIPTTEPLSTILGTHGTTDMVMQILEGSANVETLELPGHIRKWLSWMERTPKEKRLKPIPAEITPQQFREAFKVQTEMTSSSPSGLHYTLWKAGAEKDLFCDTMATMMSLPFMYGFSNERWQWAIDVMLEKCEGVRKIHLLSIIGLVEADFNTALKILYAKQLMWNAEEVGISPDQWGGRANRSAPDCATRKLLTWEHACLAKRTIGVFFGDLASCFDRMTTNVSSLVSMKKGMPRTACASRSITVRKMKRRVRTASGTSEATYHEQTGDMPLSGKIQGKGDVMGLWTLVSDSLLSVHRLHCPGVTQHHVARDEQSTRASDAYVDDANQYAECAVQEEFPHEHSGDTSDPDNTADTAPLVMEAMQRSAQLWTNLVMMVGGLMAFHKCLWQLLAWKGSKGRLVPRSRDEISGEISLCDHQGLQSNIEYLEYTKPNVGLGFSLTPLGDQQPEFTKRLKQARECALKLTGCYLSTGEAWLMLVTRIISKVTYPFMLTRFTAKQVKALAVVIDNAILPRLGVNRKTPRAMVYAPLDFGGLGYPYIGTIQDEKGISHMVKHLKWGKEIATDIRGVISQVQLESGLTEPILECPTTHLTYLADGHISHIRERLRALGGYLD